MKDRLEKLDAFLRFNEYELLKDSGSVSMDVAKSLAEKEYESFRIEQDKKFGKLSEAIHVNDTCKYVEISQEILLNLETYQSFILFGDNGDYTPIFDVLCEKKNQSINLQKS